MDILIITILVFILIAIFWYLSKLPKTDKAGQVTLSKSELEELEAIEERAGEKMARMLKNELEKTTSVPFAEFSLNAEFKCPVCKQVSKTDDHHQVIFCSHCRTPHHVNCYKEIGHCSTYGCHGQKDPQNYKMSCESGEFDLYL